MKGVKNFLTIIDEISTSISIGSVDPDKSRQMFAVPFKLSDTLHSMGPLWVS